MSKTFEKETVSVNTLPYFTLPVLFNVLSCLNFFLQ